jgi:hypothetical protein
MCRLGAIATGRRMIPSGNLSFTWLNVCLEVEPRSVGIALADGLCDLEGGGIILAEGLHEWGWRVVPLLNYTLAFALQLRKSTENLSQGSREVGDYSLRRLGRLFFFRNSLGWPAEHQSASVTRG